MYSIESAGIEYTIELKVGLDFLNLRSQIPLTSTDLFFEPKRQIPVWTLSVQYWAKRLAKWRLWRSTLGFKVFPLGLELLFCHKLQ